MTALPVRPLRLRRLLLLGFLILTCLRMLLRDRHRLADWWREIRLRLAFFSQRSSRSLWVHGEGLGEFRLAEPLLRLLAETCPGHDLILTTSRAVTRHWLHTNYPNAIALPPPWDLSFCVARFFRRLRPRLLILLEFHDAFCPGALLRARDAGVPVVVVNGRALYPPKPRRYRVADALGLVTPLARLVERFCVQDATVATGLQGCGVEPDRIVVTGNLKYDQALTITGDPGLADLRHEIPLPDDTPVLVAGCIHADEEDLILDAFAQLRLRHPRLFLILAPHDPKQVARLGAALQTRGLSGARRSDHTPAQTIAVLLLDTFGELSRFYHLATVVVLGGSFTPRGSGHSLAEPAAHGRPIVFGPYMSSQQGMVAHFLRDQAAVQATATELTATVDGLLASPEKRELLGRRARAVVWEQRGAAEHTFHAVRPLLPCGDRETPADAGLLKRTVKTWAQTAPGQAVLALRARRLPGLAHLRERLGQPETILCLGNGPSSEDPGLAELAYDCLFRVNWRWLERGRHTRPDVVFTGDRESLRRCPRCIFVFGTIAEETSVLLHWFGRPGLCRIEYLTAERLPLPLNRTCWGARPTNGAVMIACAAALQPRRLIIAGMDLFQHPAGSYPGDGHSPNRYAAVHDRRVEVAIVRQALAGYAGELILRSPALAAALAA